MIEKLILLFNTHVDKVLHFTVGLCITLLLKDVFRINNLTIIVAVTIIAIGKEVSDYINPRKRLFDVYDIVATCTPLLLLFF